MPLGSTPSVIGSVIGSVITTPRVLHVTTAGNNTTGDGSISAPYLTAQKAFDVAIAGSGDYTIALGVGAFSLSRFGEWPDRITVVGCGYYQTDLTVAIATSSTVTIRGDSSLNWAIIGVGASAGATGPTMNFYGIHGNQCWSNGVDGPGGDPGTDGNESTPGGNGGNGGPGGNGGTINLVDCHFVDVTSEAGAGGPGGSPGADGGAGTGIPGDPGTPGVRGHVTLDGCRIGSLTCETYDWGRTNVYGTVTGSRLDDYGGNTTMPAF